MVAAAGWYRRSGRRPQPGATGGHVPDNEGVLPAFAAANGTKASAASSGKSGGTGSTAAAIGDRSRPWRIMFTRMSSTRHLRLRCPAQDCLRKEIIRCLTHR